MPEHNIQRVVVVGAGTGVGKTHLTRALAGSLRARVGARSVLALKPVETGAPFDDARALQSENPFHVERHPLFAFPEPISPHLAARRVGAQVELEPVLEWLRHQETALYDNMSPYGCWVLIETAGGVLSPLGPGLRNIELAKALEPMSLVLVASDSLGALNQVDLTITALRNLARPPDHLVLSATASDDPTRGTNAAELRSLGIADPILVLGPGDGDASVLADALLQRITS